MRIRDAHHIRILLAVRRAMRRNPRGGPTPRGPFRRRRRRREFFHKSTVPCVPAARPGLEIASARPPGCVSAVLNPWSHQTRGRSAVCPVLSCSRVSGAESRRRRRSMPSNFPTLYRPLPLICRPCWRQHCSGLIAGHPDQPVQRVCHSKRLHGGLKLGNAATRCPRIAGLGSDHCRCSAACIYRCAGPPGMKAERMRTSLGLTSVI